MGQTGEWTGAGSLDTRRGVIRPSSCQGADHAILATACLSIRLAVRHRRRPRPTLRPTLVPAVARRPLCQGTTHRHLFRAAGITTDFHPTYAALRAAGRRAQALSYRLLCVALKPLMWQTSGDHLLFAIDDTPTARYGPCVQGSGIPPNPTPGPAGEKFVYGHLWVTLAWLARPPAWDTLALPLRALLYVRAQNIPALAKRYPWTFRTQLELAAERVRWLTVWLGNQDKAFRYGTYSPASERLRSTWYCTA